MVKTAVVTGGAKGIGQACVVELARVGYDVRIWDYDFAAAQQTAEAVVKKGGAASAQHVDVSDGNSVANARDALGRSTPVSVLVNSAGISGSHPDQLNTNTWDEQMNIYAKGVFLSMQAVVPIMQKAGRGSIVNISSISAFVGQA